MNSLSLRFLTRTGCHLCDEARPLVIEAVGRVGATLEEVDIDQDESLLNRFDLRIPVLLAPDDQVVAEGIIDDRRKLVRILRRLKESGG